MTGGAGGDRHKNVTYAEIETDAQGITFSVAWTDDGKKATITGHCPECHGRTRTEFPAGIPDTSTFRGPKKIPTLPSPVTVCCECGHIHEDRPAGALDQGCGRYWLLYVAAKDRVHPKYLS